jgi:hypothetical protein
LITVATPAQLSRFRNLSACGSEVHSTPACGRGSHLPPLSGPPARRLLVLFTAFGVCYSIVRHLYHRPARLSNGREGGTFAPVFETFIDWKNPAFLDEMSRLRRLVGNLLDMMEKLVAGRARSGLVHVVSPHDLAAEKRVSEESIIVWPVEDEGGRLWLAQASIFRLFAP